MAEIVKGSRVMHVIRGNLGVVLPVHPEAFRKSPVRDLAQLVVQEMERQQAAAPGRAAAPITSDGTRYALRLNGRDEALHPLLPLRGQAEGHWEWKDLPVAGQTEQTARLPVCEFELVDA